MNILHVISGIDLADGGPSKSVSDLAKVREELAAPIMKSLEAWMEKTYPTVLPYSFIGEAIGYSYSLWPRMKNYLKDGRLKLDNNLAENAICPIALSRKNFMLSKAFDNSCSVAITR